MPKEKDYFTKKSIEHGGWLSNMSDAIKEQAGWRDAARAAFNLKLGEPDFYQPHDQEDPRFGLGYWRINGGIVSYQKYANGYDPNSRHEYVDDFIDMLVRLCKYATPREGV